MNAREIKAVVDAACSKGFAAAMRRAEITPTEEDLLRLVYAFDDDYEQRLDILRCIEERAQDVAVVKRAAEFREREERSMAAFTREDGCIFEARIPIDLEKFSGERRERLKRVGEEFFSLELSSVELAEQKVQPPMRQLRRVATSFEGACGAVRNFCRDFEVELDRDFRFSIVKRRIFDESNGRRGKARKVKSRDIYYGAEEFGAANFEECVLGKVDLEGSIDIGAVGEANFAGDFLLLNVALKGYLPPDQDEYSFVMPQFLEADELVSFLDRRGNVHFGAVLPVAEEGAFASVVRISGEESEGQKPKSREEFERFVAHRAFRARLSRVDKAKPCDLPAGAKEDYERYIILRKRFGYTVEF